MDKEKVVHIHNGILFSQKEEWNYSKPVIIIIHGFEKV
jgi:hypothetical protein